MAYSPEVNNIQGWMSPNELNWLYDQANRRKCIVEVGSWRGRSTHALASGCNGAVFCVDHFKGSSNELEAAHKDAVTQDIYEQFKENMRGFRNIIVYRMDSIEASKSFEDKFFDMIFIDGNHSTESLRADLDAWLPKLKDGGLFCGHDGTYTNIENLLNEYGIPWEMVGAGSIWRLKCDHS